MRAAAWRPAAGVALSLAAYAAAVSGHWQAAGRRGDALGCPLPQAVESVAVAWAGLLAGVAVGGLLVGSGRTLLHGLLPQLDDEARQAVLRWASALVLVVSTAASVLWVRPGLDLFVASHRPLLVEVDLLLYGMGVLAGAAWSALLDRDAWLGLLLAPAMALMLISTGVVGRGWC